jgi:hypothetical protein
VIKKIELVVSEISNNPFNYNAYSQLAQYYFSINKIHEGNSILKLIKSKNERPDSSNSDSE